MNLIEAIVHAGFQKMKEEMARCIEQTGRLPHMLWAFTTDPLNTEEAPYRYTMAEIPAMPVDVDAQRYIIDSTSEDMAMCGWQFKRPELQVCIFVGPFYPNTMPQRHDGQFPTVILHAWINGHGVSSLLYPTVWQNGRLADVGPPVPVEYTGGQTYAERFAESFQGLSGARLN